MAQIDASGVYGLPGNGCKQRRGDIFRYRNRDELLSGFVFWGFDYRKARNHDRSLVRRNWDAFSEPSVVHKLHRPCGDRDRNRPWWKRGAELLHLR